MPAPSEKLKKANNACPNPDVLLPPQTLATYLTAEDLKRASQLTPSQRIEWLMMIQELLRNQLSQKTRTKIDERRSTWNLSGGPCPSV